MIPSDEDLLREYASNNSNSAFSELVRRHLNLVYSAARRQVRSSTLAEDITQSVFTDLARNAAKLKAGQPVIAWLHLVTRRTAIDVIRRESRREAREQTAVEIDAMKSNPSVWIQIEPMLDEALDTLPEIDRQAILQRYFANKSLREVGELLGTSEGAAQKRISRAIEQLRVIFVRRGVVITAAGLVTDLSAHVILTAPVALGTAVSASALAAAVVKSGAATTMLTGASWIHSALMTTFNKSLLVACGMLAVGLVFQSRLLSTMGQQQIALQQELGDVKDDIRRQQVEMATDARQGRETHERLALLRARTSEEITTEAALESWLARVATLKERIEQDPRHRIPEMAYLTSNDWLTVTLDNELATDGHVRKALAEVRALAKFKPEISQNIAQALEAFRRDHGGNEASGWEQLQPYLKPDLSADIRSRYEFVSTGAPAEEKRRLVVQEVNAIDENFDRLLTFQAGGGSGSRITGTLRLAMSSAFQAFQKAHPQQVPATADELLPYFSTPFDEAEFRTLWNARR